MSAAAACHDEHPAGIEVSAELRRGRLDVTADLIYVAEKLLTALDGVLNPKANDLSHTLSVQDLTLRLDSAPRVRRATQ